MNWVRIFGKRLFSLCTTSKVPCGSITFERRLTSSALMSPKLGNQNNLERQVRAHQIRCPVAFCAAPYVFASAAKHFPDCFWRLCETRTHSPQPQSEDSARPQTEGLLRILVFVSTTGRYKEAGVTKRAPYILLNFFIWFKLKGCKLYIIYLVIKL